MTTLQLAVSPRVRRSPFYEATLAAGATAFTVYNHMLLPSGYAGIRCRVRSPMPCGGAGRASAA